MLGLGLTKLIPDAVYALALAFIAVSFFRPKYGMYFLVLLLPFTVVLEKLQVFPLGKDINDLLFLGTILGWLLNVRDENGKVLTKNPLNKYALMMLFFSFISLIIGSVVWGLGNPFSFESERFVHWKNYIMIPVLYLMAVNLIKTRKDMILVCFLMISALFLADLYYYYNVSQKTLSFYREDLGGSIFAKLGSNELAAFFAHFIFLPLGLALHEKKPTLKLANLGIAAFTLWPILFLFSRGAYIGVFCGLLYFGLKKSRFILLLLIILVLSWMTLLPMGVVSRIQMTETENGLDHSSLVRIKYWQLGLRQFVKSPLVGVGFDTSTHFRGGDLHNEYIEILSEQGIIGMWMFLGLLFVTFKNASWVQKHAPDGFLKGIGLSMSGSIIACSVTNMFGDRWTYTELSAFLFVMMALTIKARSLAEKEMKKD